MHDDDAIRKSIKRNAQKQSQPKEHAPSKGTGAFWQFVQLLNGVQLIKVSIIVALVLAVILFNVLKLKLALSVLVAMPFLLLPVVGVAVLLWLYFYLQYVSYQKFLASRWAASSQWNAFVASRSKEFIAGKRFVKLSVTIQPRATASTLHHKAVTDFLADWVKRGENIFAGTKWAKGRPDSFRVVGFTVSGHVGVGNGMSFVMRSIADDLMSLFAEVGDENLSLVIGYDSEVTFEEDATLDEIDTAKEREYDRKLRE